MPWNWKAGRLPGDRRLTASLLRCMSRDLALPHRRWTEQRTGKAEWIADVPGSRSTFCEMIRCCGSIAAASRRLCRLRHACHASNIPLNISSAELVSGIGLDPLKYATHSMRRTKATLIYRRTGNLRAAQLLLGHSKTESTVRYLGLEIDDALDIAEKIESDLRGRAPTLCPTSASLAHTQAK